MDLCTGLGALLLVGVELRPELSCQGSPCFPAPFTESGPLFLPFKVHILLVSFAGELQDPPLAQCLIPEPARDL